MRRRLQDRAERGATAVEYALLVALVAAVLAVPLHALGFHLSDVMFPGVCERMAAGDPYSQHEYASPREACD